jgi:hypothetical protein
VRQHRQLRLIAQRKREQPFISDLSENGGGFFGCLVCARSLPVEPHDPGQPAQAEPECAPVLQLPA